MPPRRSLAVLFCLANVLLAVAATAPTAAYAADPPPCYDWNAQVSLQSAVNSNACVRVASGTWQVPSYVVVPAGHRVTGQGAGASVLQAVAPWNGNGKEGVLNVLGDDDAAQIDGLTLDAHGVATYALAARGMSVSGTVLENGVCNGLGIAGKHVTITGSTVRGNGFACQSAPPGSGIYVEGRGLTDKHLDPVIDGNTITGNAGPGLDVNNAYGGRFTGNQVHDNGSWAAVSLYGAQGWTVSSNTVSQPATAATHPYHPACGRDLPNGPGSAAVLLCQDADDSAGLATTGNTVDSNTLSGSYGLALTGNGRVDPALVPQSNALTNNTLTGSGTACVDSYLPGQSDSNSWSGNSCSSPLIAPAHVAGRYHPLTPQRILDTRSTAPVQPGADRTLQVLGAGGVPSSGVAAVVLGVTVPSAPTGGDLEVYPGGAQPVDRTSNLNWAAHQTVANSTTVAVGADGTVVLSEDTSASDVIVDVLGWYGDASDTNGLRYTALTPSRVLDTRTDHPVAAGVDRRLLLRGTGGVPVSTDVTSVALVLTALGASSPADVQMYPTGARPAVRTSNTNLVRGQTVAVGVNATLGPDGSVSLSVSQGTVSVVIDVLGYYGSHGSRYVPLTPQRILSRTSLAGGDDHDLTQTVGGRAGVPSDAEAVLVNLTGVGATRPTDVEVYPTGNRPQARTSALNLLPGRAVPDALPARLAEGALSLSASGTGTLQVILDQLGYFTRN